MSFADAMGRGNDANRYHAVTDFDVKAAKKEVQQSIKRVTQNSADLAKYVKLLGTNKEPQDCRARINQLTNDTRELARNTNRQLKMSFQYAQNSKIKAELTTLSNEFKAKLQTFQDNAEMAAHVAKETGTELSPENSLRDDGVGDGSGPLMASQIQQQEEQMQRQIQIENAIEFNEDLIAERQQGVQSVAVAVQEVQEIFQDLALLVNEQGEAIDNIQANVESAANQTERAVGELRQANRSQKKMRSRMCCLAVLLLVVIAVTLIILKFVVKMAF